MAQQPPQRIPAPPLDGALGWLNTDRPLDPLELRGKIVLIDFWTYCCINCLHVLPDLAYLERKYPNELVVIGVHSAKFENERHVENVREAVLRYEIAHPVCVDRNFAIWKRYAVRGWPTLWLIDAEGFLAGQVSGEGNRGLLDNAIAELIAEYEPLLLLDRTPMRFPLEREKAEPTPLRYPGKVLAAEDGRLFIADTNHNRIVLARTDGTVDAEVGGPEPGLADGDFRAARFDHPQGMALDGDSLYVADTENHAIRRIDLAARTVETVAGTGRIARYREVRGRGTAADLNSPWDLALTGRTLFAAMAGPHQIWRIDLDTREVSVHSGSGQEARIDGPHAQAALAQPSGLAYAEGKLYVADSEISAVREIDAAPGGGVRTLVGLDLFEFGDEDGEGDRVRLQHPLGVAVRDGVVYVADTYNHKVKVLDPRTRRARTLLGSGGKGFADGRGEAAAFYEPGGLSIAGDKLYVADTNNHAIRVADLSTLEVATLWFPALEPEVFGERLAHAVAEAAHVAEVKREGEFLLPTARTIDLPPARVRPGAANLWQIRFDLPPGFHPNADAPFLWRVWTEGGGIAVEGAGRVVEGRTSDLPLLLSLKAPKDAAPTTLHFAANVPYCSDGGGMCFVASLVLRQEVSVAEGASDWLGWTAPVEA